MFDRPALASIALGTNSSGMTAMGNDYGFEKVFAREMEALAKKEDVFIGITTSGNSPNIINAVEVARKIGIKTYVLTGETEGVLEDKAECIHVPSKDTPRIQENHILIGHIICGFVEQEIFGNK
jgi:D-sedoheptulose 7-phosphate isomerase